MSLRLASLLMLFGSAPSADAAPEEKVPVRLGASIALTGKLADMGAAEKQGFELAAEDINAASGFEGRGIRLLFEDNASDPKAALNGANKLFDSDKVDFFFTAFSHITQALEARLKRAKVLFIYHASIGHVAAHNTLGFRDWADIDEQTLALMKFAKSEGRKRVAYLGEQHEACQAYEGLLRERHKEFGFELLSVENYVAGEVDFKPMLLRISQRQPDAVFVCSWRDGGILMSQMKALNLIKLPTYQQVAPLLGVNDTPEVRKLYEENAAVSSWLVFAEGELNSVQEKFFQRVKERFGNAPRIETLIAFDDLFILEKAARGCLQGGGVDQLCVAKNLAQTTSEGVSGPVCFDDLRRARRPTLLIRVIDGRWKKVFEDGGVCASRGKTG